jgi:hypothetical protein
MMASSPHIHPTTKPLFLLITTAKRLPFGDATTIAKCPSVTPRQIDSLIEPFQDEVPRLWSTQEDRAPHTWALSSH